LEGTEWEAKPSEDNHQGTYNPECGRAKAGIFNNHHQLWDHNQFWEIDVPEDSNMPSELKKRSPKSFAGQVASFKTNSSSRGGSVRSVGRVV